MSLLLNMLSRLVITFLPRSKHLLISWLQSPSTVILEPKKTNSDTVSTVSPYISQFPNLFHNFMYQFCLIKSRNKDVKQPKVVFLLCLPPYPYHALITECETYKMIVSISPHDNYFMFLQNVSALRAGFFPPHNYFYIPSF